MIVLYHWRFWAVLPPTRNDSLGPGAFGLAPSQKISRQQTQPGGHDRVGTAGRPKTGGRRDTYRYFLVIFAFCPLTVFPQKLCVLLFFGVFLREFFFAYILLAGVFCGCLFFRVGCLCFVRSSPFAINLTLR